MPFENQNARSKIRLELDNGVLVEVPLVVVVRAMQEQFMHHGPTADEPPKQRVHWGFADFFSDDPRSLVHLIVSTKSDELKGE